MLYSDHYDVLDPFMHLFLIYTLVMSLKTALFELGLSGIVTHKSVNS